MVKSKDTKINKNQTADVNTEVPEAGSIRDAIQNGQSDVAKLFSDHHRTDIKCADKKAFAWNIDTALWEEMKSDELVARIGKFIASLYDAELADLSKMSLVSQQALKPPILKEKARCTRAEYARGVLTYVWVELTDKDFVEKLDGRPDVVNFKNGVYELKTGKFRARKQKDLFSQCLAYDYEDADPKLVKKINRIIRQISNDNEELCEFNLSWFGYCLTGETSLQKWLLIQGHTAENGKTTMLRMFTYSFPIYGKVVNQGLVEADNQKRHKFVAGIGKPVRLIYIEELNRKKMDAEEVKRLADGGKYDNEVMYGTSTLKTIQCKLTATTNKDPKFDADNGWLRRFLAEELTNQFVSKDDYVEGCDNMYLRDENLFNLFESDHRYQLAFAHILLPYAMQFYNDGLKIPKIVKDTARELCNMNDPTREFITEHFKVTKNENDKIPKDDLLQYYKSYSGMTRITVNYLNSELKKFGVKYSKAIRANGKKGCFIGIKQIKPIEKSDDANDDLDIVDV